MPSELYSISAVRIGPFPTEGVSSLFLSLPRFMEITKANANSVDPDQAPRSAASDLMLNCLPMFLLRHYGNTPI